jgi:hypothetical protein
MRQYLPFLLVLACPLMMVFMMRGMMGHGSHGKDDAKESDAAMPRIDEATSAAELQQLRDDLTARLGQLDSRIEELEHAETGWKTPMRA